MRSYIFGVEWRHAGPGITTRDQSVEYRMDVYYDDTHNHFALFARDELQSIGDLYRDNAVVSCHVLLYTAHFVMNEKLYELLFPCDELFYELVKRFEATGELLSPPR